MAEGESKKPIVEMSVWFIILLVVIIIATALVLKKNGELESYKARVEELQTSLAKEQAQSKERAQLILDIKNMAVDGDLSKNLVLKKIGEVDQATNEGTETTTSGEVISGEEDGENIVIE